MKNQRFCEQERFIITCSYTHLYLLIHVLTKKQNTSFHNFLLNEMFSEESYIDSSKYETRDMLKAEMLRLYMNSTKVFTCISTVE